MTRLSEEAQLVMSSEYMQHRKIGTKNISLQTVSSLTFSNWIFECRIARGTPKRFYFNVFRYKNSIITTTIAPEHHSILDPIKYTSQLMPCTQYGPVDI